MKFTIALFLWSLLLLTCGCASLVQPRVNDDLKLNSVAGTGATHDASRGFPIAFYSNPGQDPEEVTVDHGLGPTRVRVAQWVTELARQLNIAIAKVSLFDQRFSAVSQQVYAYEVSDGDLSFAWREPVEGIPLSGERPRIAKLRLNGMTTASTSEGVVATASVEVNLGGFRKVYACERAGERWDRAVFGCLGEQILSDTLLWQAAQDVK